MNKYGEESVKTRRTYLIIYRCIHARVLCLTHGASGSCGMWSLDSIPPAFSLVLSVLSR